MNVIITGGEGFIGSALAKELTRRGARVTTLDRNSGQEASNIAYLLLKGIYSTVFHLAAQTSVFNGDKAKILDDNIKAFANVCDACQHYKVRLVYASSSTAYPPNTTSMYGISKHFDEQYAQCYYPEATGVRLHNVYGPDPRQGTLLWHLLASGTAQLVNEGRNVRHFTYIADAVEGLIYASGCKEQLLNVANPETTSVLDFAKEVQRYKPLEIKLVNESRKFDKAEQVLQDGIETVPLPYVTVAEGIRRIFEGR